MPDCSRRCSAFRRARCRIAGRALPGTSMTCSAPIRLAVSSAARGVAAQLFSGAGTLWRTPFWYRASDRQPVAAPAAGCVSSCRTVPRSCAPSSGCLLCPRLSIPGCRPALRYVAPYHEALARLAGREKPPALTRLLNRFWIGQTSMAVGEIAQRSMARGAGRPNGVLRVPEGTDLVEWYYEQGLSDGLPVVPPTPAKVDAMLEALGGEPDRRGAVPPRWGSLTREVLAINMVMAGCKPEYAPVVRAAMLALCANGLQPATACRRRRTWQRRCSW